jgi:hypothetical protein
MGGQGTAWAVKATDADDDDNKYLKHSNFMS